MSNEVLGQLVVIQLPDIATVGQDPNSEIAVKELQKLLLLILGCAVQCDKKEEIIENIKKLDVEIQHSIVQCIQEVTDNPETVWLPEWNDLHLIQVDQQESMFRLAVRHLKNLVKERDDLCHVVTEIILGRIGIDNPTRIVQKGLGTQFSTDPEKHHYGVELADSKSKVRRLRLELEEKTETLAECKEDLEITKAKLSKLKQENLLLVQDARAANTYRDELDIVKERANKVDKLEAELQKYKDKLNEMDFYKSRIEELREDNRILIETKEMLEDQLDSSRRKAETIPELENEILRLKSKVNEMSLEHDANHDRIQDLLGENAQLQMSTKHSMNESANLLAELNHLQNQASPGLGDSLCDQLNKDAHGKLMKLQLENQRLLSVLQHLREGSFHEHSEKILELEKDNKRLCLKIGHLQEVNKQEIQQRVELEHIQRGLICDSKKLQEVLEFVRESSDQQSGEFQREKIQLVELVNLLCQRSEKSKDARLVDLDVENKKLVASNQEIMGHVSHLNLEKQQLEKLGSKLKLAMEQLLEMENIKASLEKENQDLHKVISAFKQTCDRFEKLELENLELQTEIQSLNKKLENLQFASSRVEKLEQDNIYLKIENKKCAKNLEILKSSSQKIIDLEQEKLEVQQTNQLLKKNLEALKIDRVKQEQLEVDLMSSNTENQRLQKAMDLMVKKANDVEREIQHLEGQNHKLQKTVDTYKMSTRKLNDLEVENTDLEAKNHKFEREKTSMEKELVRLRQSTDLKGQLIDDFSSKISLLERENKRLAKDLESHDISACQVSELEKDNRELVQQSAIDKKTLATLREDLVSEKIKTQQLANELDKLTTELHKIGLDKEKLLLAEQVQDEHRYKALENMIDEALKKGLEIKEEKIQALDSRLKESANRNHELHEELRVVHRQYEALKQRHEEEVLSNKPQRSHEVEVQSKMTAKQIHNLRDQFNESEKMNVTVLEENRQLRCQVGSARDQVNAFHSQVTSLQHQATALTEQNSSLQSQNACLQVELSALQSQNSYLSSQNGTLQGSKTILEASKAQSMKLVKEAQSAHGSLVGDHEALQKLHEQLSMEYDSLLKELGSLKSAQRELRTEYKASVDRCQALLSSQEGVHQMRLAIDEDRETLKSETRSLNNLRMEHSKLKDDFRLLHTTSENLKVEYKNLQSEYKSLKTEFNKTKLKNMELQGDIAECRHQASSLDIEIHKLISKNEMLANVNMTLRDERHSLVSQVSCLLTQYHELLTQALEDKEHFHEKEKNNMDKVNQLERQKAQLETKIMEQFMRMENYSPKKVLSCAPKGFGATLVRKVRRAGSELINKVPRASRSKGGENSDTATMDHLDNSSAGSGSIGPDSPDGGSDNGGHYKEFGNGDNMECITDMVERRGSIRRSYQTKSNSVFYTKVLPSEDPSLIERGSVTSNELADNPVDSSSIASGLQCKDDIRFVGSLHQDMVQSPSQSITNSEDVTSDHLSCLGTPGSRRAVYYSDDHDDTIPTRDVGPNSRDALASSSAIIHHPPSPVAPKLTSPVCDTKQHPARVCVTPVPDLHIQNNHATIMIPSIRDQQDQKQCVSLVESPKTAVVPSTECLPPIGPESPVLAFTNSKSTATQLSTGRSSSMLLQMDTPNLMEPGNSNRPISFSKAMSNERELLEESQEKPQVNLETSSLISLSPRASAMLGQASKVVSQLTNVNNENTSSQNSVVNHVGLATTAIGALENGVPRTVDNSIWYEYGCV